MPNYKDLIESNYKIMLGKPVIKGTRVTVENIIKKFSEGATVSELIEMYPNLTTNHIYACLDYASEVISNEEFLELA